MVNPLTSNTSASLPQNPTSLEAELPTRPEPARQVTAPGEALGADNSNHHPSNRPATDAARPLEQALDDMNSSLKAWSTGMRFDVDEDTQRVVVSIVDNDTGKVLRTVPSDAVIKIAKMIVQFQGQGVRTSA